MSRRYYRPSELPLREIDPEAWKAAIDERYGLRLRDNPYADRRGVVYAGSEYVATLGDSVDPGDAHTWAGSVAAFERRQGKTELVEHLSLAEQTRRHGAAYREEV